MKKLILAAALSIVVLTAAPVCAQEDKAKAAGCTTCHAVDTKKTGPSFKSVAEKYKGKADAEATLTAKLTKGHGGKKPSADDAKALVSWILGL